jgi:GT2 family glycosyltransferase
MKRIALFCVSYESDKELVQYRQSLEKAIEKAKDLVSLDIFVAHNTQEDNPGYFGAVKRLMDDVDITVYDYTIISNVDVVVEEDFFLKLADYKCEENTGWIAPQIWSHLEERDRNPKILNRYSLRKLNILKAFYQFPLLDTLYTRTFYRQKKYKNHPAGKIYAGHGSLIILTNKYFKRCGKIDYPIFLFCEEIYLAEMCRKARLEVEYVPSIKVTDSEHASTSRMKHSFYCRCNYEAMQYIIRTFY